MNKKQTRFAAVYCVYDDDRWLPYSLESVYSACDAIFFLVGSQPWHGSPSDNTSTLDAIASFPDPDQKIRLVQGDWSDETTQRNCGLELLEKDGIDLCFIVDADEIYDTEQLTRMMQVVASNPEIGCFHMVNFTYWKDMYHRIEPPEEFKPPVFVRVGKGQFVEFRNVQSDVHALIHQHVGMCHHMSYARTNEEIFKKITTFSHANQLIPNWYENVWLAWDDNHELANLHPTHPAAYQRAIEQPLDVLPPVLRRLAEQSNS